MVRAAIILMTYVLIALSVKSQQPKNEVFDEAVRSLQVYTTATGEGSVDIPVIVLGSNENIIIEFDMLVDSPEYLKYSVTHCDRQWRPDGLTYTEFLDGFNESPIDKYELSLSTTVPYVHYMLTIPNPDFNPYLSGNYILSVYPEYQPEQPFFNVCFALCEGTSNLGATWTGRTDRDYNSTHQQLEIRADVENANVRDLFNDLTLVITQNGRSDDARTLIHPLRVSGNRLIYEHQPELIFEGGNEYRRFETVSKLYTPMGVDRIDFQAPYYRYILNVDKPRANDSYLYDRTLSGGYIIRAADNVSPDPLVSDTEADYAVVYFALEMPELFGKTVYIDSDITGRRHDASSAMTYNQSTGRYEKAMLLKQGAYSYQYLVKDDRSGETTVTPTEGNHYETRNHYTLRLYHRVPGERYDRLIGYSAFDTIN